MSIRDSLRRLVELQAAEIELRQLEAALGALPAERRTLRDEVEGARAAVQAAEAAREDCLKHRRKLEGELKDVEAKLDKYREHELQVKTNEQLWALQAEMRTVQERIGAIETGILEEMERADALGERIVAAKATLAAEEKRVAEALAEVDARDAEMQSRASGDRERIAQLRVLVGEILEIYDKVRSVRAGIGISEITEAGTCSACQVRLRPQVTLEVTKMEAPLQCDSCKRLLFSRQALELPSSMQVAAD